MKIILSHPTGNENVRAALSGFHQANLLSAFYTSIATFPGSILDNIGKFPYFSELHRRRFQPALRNVTHTYPYLEIIRQVLLKMSCYEFTKSEQSNFSIDSLYKTLDRHVALKLRHESRNELKAIYAYEDCAINSFKQAKILNYDCLYDLPIGYWRSARRLLEYEKQRWPDWVSTLTIFNDSSEKLQRKDEELGLAERIFVASEFTAQTLKEYPGELACVEVIPYGFPTITNLRVYEKMSRHRRLKVLFVGGLSQRKGIANLFAAINKFGNHVKLTIVGRKVSNDCKALDIELAKHLWIPSLSHDKILQLMREHDVLVFPSLFEGFGLVITESMSQGTAVITTERTAGPDLIKNGTSGWIIKAGSTEALQEAIENLLINPLLIEEVGRAALDVAGKRPWATYGKELAERVINTQSKWRQ